jgi:single-stranded-DNA-specific exonuclease
MIVLKYVLKGENDYENPIQTVLKNRNISEELFSLKEDVIEDYNNYDNMEDGIKLLLKHINNNSKIAMVIDPDVDGFVSFAITYNRIKDINPNINIVVLIHTEKQHGLSEDITIEDDIDFVILTDSSSNDFKQHKKLKNRNIDILVIDHHNCDDGYSPYATVINNQLSLNVKNKNGCGAFVCYKFLKALDNYLFENKADYVKDIVSIANVADVMDLHEKETRYFVYEGMKEINNTFLKALIDTNSYELESKYNIDKIGWTIAPKLNATVRSGTQEEKLKMAKAFISDDYNFCLDVANMCKKIKSRQDSAVKSALKKLELKIKIKEDDRCIILDVGKTLKKPHTGLVAGKIADKYKLPTLLYRQVESKKDFVGGSFRGIDNISKDLRIDILNSGLVEFSQGHEQAGGWQCNKMNLEKLKEYLNELYKDKQVINSNTYEVDFVLNEEDITYNMIYELSQYEDEWGNGIPEPLIVFKDLIVNITDENIKGSKAKNMIFEINGVKFIKKYLSNVLKDSFLNKGDLKVSIIGKVVNNIYNDNTYPQVEIIELEITD